MNLWTRRRALQATLASGVSSLWPWASVFAQSGGGAGLLRAPKQALVIGNSKYRQSPLRNPVNDAQGMAAALKSTGFNVTLGLELSQADLREAFRAYGESLIKAKAVGLFYFAGHGVQLTWRNYLIPVDAEILNVEQLRERAIDVNSLIEGIRKAGNPMNIVILDACRNNPFGGQAQVEQKGLSQLDAPPGTLLAYATAPGNTAIDGEGENGLYTEHLLREMKIPEAKVEDVFKRVRLAVRRRSNGQQIPWESTSLEEDFWFIPPAQIKKLAEAEAEREFKEDLALWERAQSATEHGPLEEYLRRYPSGRFAELAQLKLDQVLAKQGEKKVEVVSAPQNPYTKGTARTDTAYRIGDRYTYRQFNTLTNLEGNRYTHRVTDIGDDEVIFNNGGMVTDLLGNYRKWGRGIWATNQLIPAEFVVGKRWNTRFTFTDTFQSSIDLDVIVLDRERITVPAGTFNAFRVRARGWRTAQRDSPWPGQRPDYEWEIRLWFAPEQVRRPLVWEWFTARGYATATRHELVAFKQS